MSTRPPDNNTGPLDHLSMRYLRQALEMPHPTDEPYVLNEFESRVVRRTKNFVLTLSALLGALGVLAFFLPQQKWPDTFSTTSVAILGQSYELALVNSLYALLLVYLEVNVLLWLGGWGVKMIMEVCQFPRAHDAQYERHIQALADETPTKSRAGLFRLGLDPYLTMPRWGLPIFFLLNILKASFIMLVIQLVLGQFLDEYTLRQTVGLLSVPIYAFWNGWAAWQVLHEAQIRVMAPTTIREFVHELHEEWGKNDQFFPIIMEALLYTSILKGPVSYAHFLLTETIVDRFGLSADVPPGGHFTEQLITLPLPVRRSLERLVVFASLVDGRLSWVEKRRLRTLRQKGFLTYSASEIQRISTDYNQGRGLWV
ncbi:LBF_2804 family protein [Spirosoma spitsbergense]|jgi:hypothetical protein|uniref:LBF_2804 family protein n=1 Tax=Spirosoma spitsbergense TaxID=431554 RepID=UPI00039E0D65|nr:hypothetical protein [Spirosoma spitsbergense]